MRTLKDVKEEEEENNGKQPQEWYTGGASSGQNVIDPKQQQRNEEDEKVPTDSRYGTMFQEALRHGAIHRHEDEDDENERRRGASGGVFFSGRGRKMTEEEGEGEEELDGDLEEEEEEEKVEQIQRTITFYNNGFTVDDGPLRDPAENQEFMEMIGRGMCPPELMHPGASARNPVKIDLKREMRDWEAPKGVKAFSGSGNKLTSEADGDNKEGGQQKSLEQMKPWAVDDKEPTTSIQIRLHDGSRLVAKFNLSHTVAHIRDFIRQAKGEQCATRALQLSGFPPEKLDDDSRTIENGLKGCVVQQK